MTFPSARCARGASGSHAVILDPDGCLNLFLARPGNLGISTFRQEGPGGAFVRGPSLPGLPL